MVSLSGKASERGATWAESWNISMWLSTTAAKRFRWRNPNSGSFPSDRFMQPDASGSTISPLFSGLLFSPGDLNPSLAAAALLVLVPVRELTWDALLLLLLPRPENSWSCLSSLGEGGGAEHACASIPGSACACIWGRGAGGGVHLGSGLHVYLQVLPQKTEVDIQKIKWQLRISWTSWKMAQRRGEVEITSTKTEWNREGSCIRRGRMPMSCWRATNVTKQK